MAAGERDSPDSNSDPRARARDQRQVQLRGFAQSLAEVEWLLLVLVILFLLLVRPGSASAPEIVATLIGFAGFVLLFRYTAILADRPETRIGVEVLAMIAFLTAVLAAGGSEAGMLVNLYLLPIITAALALGRRAALLVTGLVAVCYVLVTTLAGGVEALTSTLAIEIAAVLLPFVLVAWLTTLLTRNLDLAQARMRAMAERDELTGLYNLRAFTRIVAPKHEVAARAGGSYAVVLVDVIALQSINRLHGRDAGDRVLQLVAGALLRQTRSADVVGRHGGDEFVLFISGADIAAAQDVAQRIRNAVFATTLEIDDTIVRVQVAAGAAAFPTHGNTAGNVMLAAEQAARKDRESGDKPRENVLIRHL